MLRVLGNKVILPARDTGIFALPLYKSFRNTNSIAIFSIYDPLFRKTIFEKQAVLMDDKVVVDLTSDDTKDLEPGDYKWDVKLYYMPRYNDYGELIGAGQIDSYYSAYRLPSFIIKEVGKENV